MTDYKIYALDNENCELKYDWGITSMKKAIKIGREFLNDPDLANELYKVEVRDENGEVEWDKFV